jgi:protein-S-isoprenylcysteine O-methyltransferase Ste14
MDAGRLIIVPIFGLLLAANIAALYGDLRSFELGSVVKAVMLIHRLLLVCFYALLVYLYFIRRPARSSTRSFAVKTAAVVGTFLPFAIPALSRPSENPALMLSASMVTIFGIAFALYSISTLGGSFSIIPQARELVQTGPYKIVRHPVYLGELIAIFGFVMARFSPPAAAVYCLFAAAQIYRALQEEKVLAGTFPRYEAHFLKTARFIPGIF